MPPEEAIAQLSETLEMNEINEPTQVIQVSSIISVLSNNTEITQNENVSLLLKRVLGHMFNY